MSEATLIQTAEEFGAVRFGGDLLCYVSNHWYKVVLNDCSFLRASQAGLTEYRGEAIGVNEWGVRMDPVMTFRTVEAAFAARDKAFKVYMRDAKRQKP